MSGSLSWHVLSRLGAVLSPGVLAPERRIPAGQPAPGQQLFLLAGGRTHAQSRAIQALDQVAEFLLIHYGDAGGGLSTKPL